MKNDEAAQTVLDAIKAAYRRSRSSQTYEAIEGLPCRSLWRCFLQKAPLNVLN